MGQVTHTPNHVTNPETGFLENPAYASQFDSIRKQQFLELYRNNGMGLYRTCRSLGLSTSTIHKHYQLDPIFKAAFDETKTEYGDELEATSRQNALNPRSVIERIFQLKALYPEKYGDRRTSGEAINITLNLDGKTLEFLSKRDQIFDVDAIDSTPVVESKVVEDQPVRLPTMDEGSKQNE